MQVSGTHNEVYNEGKADIVVTSDDKHIVLSASEPIKVTIEDDTMIIRSQRETSKCGYGANTVIARGQSVSIVNGQVWINGQRLVADPSREESKEHKAGFALKWLADPGVWSSITCIDEGGLDLTAVKTFSPTLQVTSSGTGDITMGSLVLDSFHVKVSGTGDVMAQRASIGNLTVLSSGTGDVDLKSLQADNVNILLSGTGDVSLPKADVKKAVVNLSGTGDVRGFTATMQADLHLSGTGDIKCRALPTCKVHKRATGTGEISVKSCK